MRRAVLLYNPVSGRPGHRIASVERIAQALRKQQLDVDITATEGPGTAGAQAERVEADILFACGGDGTIHEVIQGLIGHPRTALGVIPMGYANALARHLKLSMSPVKAALQQLNRKPELVPLGHVAYQTDHGEQSRYFIVMTGAGPDGALVYKMLDTQKHRFGRLSYYVRAANLFCRTHFSPFPITCIQTSGVRSEHQVVSAMSVRVGDLGGLFSPLIRGGEPHHFHLRLTIAKTPAHLSLPAWFAMSWAQLERWNRRVETLEVKSFHCGAGAQRAVHVQADGEWLGSTPMTVTLVPDAIRLLLPPSPVTSPTVR